MKDQRSKVVYCESQDQEFIKQLSASLIMLRIKIYQAVIRIFDHAKD